MKEAIIDGTCVVWILTTGILTCCVVIPALSGVGYWAYKIDTIRGHHIRCDKKFNATVELVLNEAVKVIVGRKNYIIDSLPDDNITIGSNVIVYSSCRYSDCESRRDVEYSKEFWWNPPKARTDCSGSLIFIITFPIIAAGICILIIVLSIMALCITEGIIDEYYEDVNDKYELEEACENMKRWLGLSRQKLQKQYFQSAKDFEEF